MYITLLCVTIGSIIGTAIGTWSYGFINKQSKIKEVESGLTVFQLMMDVKINKDAIEDLSNRLSSLENDIRGLSEFLKDLTYNDSKKNQSSDKVKEED